MTLKPTIEENTKFTLGAACTAEGCEADAFTKGLCHRHYQRVRRTGSLEGARGPAPDGYVLVPDAAEMIGVSVGAITQAVRRGAIDAEMVAHRYEINVESLREFEKREKRPSNQAVCDWEGCDRRSRAQGFCMKHYQKVVYSSKHEHLLPESYRKPRCFVDACDEPQYVKGLCRKHDMQDRHGTKSPLEPGEMFAEPDPTTAGGRIAMLRVRRGMSLREVADKCGFTHQWLSQIEKSRGKPNPKTLKVIGEALGVTADVLVPEGFGSTVADLHPIRCPHCQGKIQIAGKVEGYRADG